MDKDILDKVESPGSILMTYRGSISHGTFIPSTDPNSIDDIDLMGVYIESPDFYMGLDHKIFGFGGTKSDTQEFWIDQYDVVNYELRKLFGLLLKSNPNVLMLLFLNNEHIISKDPLWNKIVENRDIFVSAKAYYSFGGYAKEQLKKMTHFNEDEGTYEVVKEIEAELSLRSRKKGGQNSRFNNTKTQHLREQLNILKKTQGYMGDKRRGLVKEYGYDVKNATHLIRLLRMGCEFLKSGTLTVDRTKVDAEELKEIKTGKWSLDEVIREGKAWDKQLDFWMSQNRLPDKPDYEAANQLCTEIIKEYYERMRNAG